MFIKNNIELSITRLTIESFLEQAETLPVFDVRSPGEYEHAHIPGAFNLVLFDNEQRKKIGTAYKQQGKQPAIKLGLDFFGPRMSKMIKMVEKVLRMAYPDSNKILVHCWRGGMRSGAVAWLLDFYGYEVYLLEGGYKAYRNYVLQSFEKNYPFVLLGGYTGSGKTELLHELMQLHQQVLDLEGIASHKGSAFGGIGMDLQPTQEMFENKMIHELRKIMKSNPTQIWVEDESQRIGKLNIPHGIWNQMRLSTVYFLDIPFNERLDYILKDYGKQDVELLMQATERIQKRLGPLETSTALYLLKELKIKEAFAILLKYYDKLYKKSLHNRNDVESVLHAISLAGLNRDEKVRILLKELDNNNLPEKSAAYTG